MAEVLSTNVFQRAYLAHRNRVIKALEQTSPAVHQLCLRNETFQSGLDAIDPECRSFIQSLKIRDLVEMGLIKMIESAVSLERIKWLDE